VSIDSRGGNIMKDISLKTDPGVFIFKVGAVIIHDGKVLMVKTDGFPYYYTVGGRVEFGETSEDAVLREVFEETNVVFKIDRLAFIHENFFIADFMDNTYCHEIALYYIMKPSCDLGKVLCNSTGFHGEKESLHWLPLDKLSDYPIFPEFYRTELQNINKEVVHFITKDGTTTRVV